ncbi:unnamed protein product [Schistocephalus solidus]|uniref:Uncharacterized protein n=1 Tax=Schistocephalus solidus TaxID=70667 RepID=A0A183TNR0_SCHSO|nr:unnamed protein product [Schistocephalus solidus]
MSKQPYLGTALRASSQRKGLENVPCCSRPRLADHKKRGRKAQTNNNTTRPISLHDTLQAARVSPLTLAAWNVHSILNNLRSNRPERRMVLVARELARYKAEIVALSETRFSKQVKLEEVRACYTFWSGLCLPERPHRVSALFIAVYQ